MAHQGGHRRNFHDSQGRVIQADCLSLLYKVPWFSKCNVVILVFELTKELKLFIKEDKKIEDKFSNNCFLQQLAYL